MLLIDEIDKAEPELPNDLLEPLDPGRFDLPDGFGAHHETGSRTFVQAPAQSSLRLFTIITTNSAATSTCPGSLPSSAGSSR